MSWSSFTVTNPKEDRPSFCVIFNSNEPDYYLMNRSVSLHLRQDASLVSYDNVSGTILWQSESSACSDTTGFLFGVLFSPTNYKEAILCTINANLVHCQDWTERAIDFVGKVPLYDPDNEIDQVKITLDSTTGRLTVYTITQKIDASGHLTSHYKRQVELPMMTQ